MWAGGGGDLSPTLSVITNWTGKKYQCSECELEFTAMNSVKKHQKAMHEGIKYSCAICGKQLSHPDKVKRHMKTVHKTDSVERICLSN